MSPRAASQVPWGRPAHRVPRATPVLRDLPVRRGRRALPGIRVRRDRRVFPVLGANRDLPALQAQREPTARLALPGPLGLPGLRDRLVLWAKRVRLAHLGRPDLPGPKGGPVRRGRSSG